MTAYPILRTDTLGYVDVIVDNPHTQLDSEDWMQLFQGIIDQGSRGVIFDCADINTPSSPFMSALAWCRQLAHKNGFDVCIINCHSRLLKALQVTELTSVLLLAANREEAIEKLNAES